MQGLPKTKQIEQVIKQVRRRLPPGHLAANSVPEDPSEDDDDEEAYVYRLGNIPPKTHDPNL